MISERNAQALILGGGISGVGAAIRLLRDTDLEDVLILERADALGGTWLHNTYPGCACDVPSALYSFEFAPNPNWSRTFAPASEIRDYVQRVADEYDVSRRAVLGTEVLQATWNEESLLWQLETTRGRFSAPIFIFAPGPLHEPIIPALPGLESFAGPSFHSAGWDHSVNLTGKRVAVVGTGASAAQFVPEIQPLVQSMSVFQRTPGWVLPKADWRTSRVERAVYRRFSLLMAAIRRAQWLTFDAFLWTHADVRRARMLEPIAKSYLRYTVRDRAMRAALTPDYAFGCKRTLLTSAFLPALTKPNVRLVPHAIREVRERSVVSADGVEHAVDAIIWGTGFHVADHPALDRIRGRDGRTLTETWNGNPRAYLGSSMAGFPNAFMIFGPNVATGSGFATLEGQLNHITGAIRRLRAADAASIEVRPEAVRAFKAEVERRLAPSTWVAGGCASYYKDATGENYSVWPGTLSGFVRRTARFDPDKYELHVRELPSDHASTLRATSQASTPG
jgi:cation diffusion facilitator CzcD-associated flavoprotein CzcO